ncbi:MAG: dienelactone hydrolase family protein [Paracoccaceae bacterium]
MPPIVVAETDRRAFLAGTLSLPLASVLAFPDLARAQAARLEAVSFPTAGGRTAKGVIAMPEVLPAPAVLLIHEWWGLNDQIKAVAAELAELGYIAFVIDLYDGKVATTPQEARALTQALDGAAATDELASAVAFLRSHEGATGKVGTIGWCFGGGWSLNASIAAPVDATVIYYGRVTAPAGRLSQLKGPVLGHFGTLDNFINEEMVGGFEREMAKAGKAGDLSVNWYTANHAFANPSGARYDEDDAALAWSRTQAFFARYLRG